MVLEEIAEKEIEIALYNIDMVVMKNVFHFNNQGFDVLYLVAAAKIILK